MKLLEVKREQTTYTIVLTKDELDIVNQAMAHVRQLSSSFPAGLYEDLKKSLYEASQTVDRIPHR